MDFIYTHHAEKKMSKRQLKKSLIESAINNPDEIISTVTGKLIAHKLTRKKLLRVVYVKKANSYIVITAYYTEPSRYMVNK